MDRVEVSGGGERAALDAWFIADKGLPPTTDTTDMDSAWLAWRAWKARAAMSAPQARPVTMSNDGNSEAEFIGWHALNCPACGGSGHKDDVPATVSIIRNGEQARPVDDSTDYDCPDCGKLNYKPLRCQNCGHDPEQARPDGDLYDTIFAAVKKGCPKCGDAHDNPERPVLNFRELEAIAGAVFAAVFPLVQARPDGGEAVRHVKWLHTVLRENGHCIDGGKCHHGCKLPGPCSRQDGCVPLTGSALRDDWTLSPAPAPDVARLVERVEAALNEADIRICRHETTHRGGAIWEICDDCGQRWADDQGGRKPDNWPDLLDSAYEALAPFTAAQQEADHAPE